MTSFAFILGVVPLVLGSGAGANAQKSIGIAVLTLGSTLLTVAFVPSMFVVLQRFEEWRAGARRQKRSCRPPEARPFRRGRNGTAERASSANKGACAERAGVSRPAPPPRC
jgi:AcrB/AcrD/AcrF family